MKESFYKVCAYNVHLSHPSLFDRPDVTSREGWPMALYRCLSWVGTYVCAVVDSSLLHRHPITLNVFDCYNAKFNIVLNIKFNIVLNGV